MKNGNSAYGRWNIRTTEMRSKFKRKLVLEEVGCVYSLVAAYSLGVPGNSIIERVLHSSLVQTDK